MAQADRLASVRAVTDAAEGKYGLPQGTLYKIAGIESSHGLRMTSPVGAEGWFQFMPDTGKAYGVGTSADRMDLDKSADAAGRYMRDLLKQYDGNMNHALAAYNGGYRAVNALKAGKPWKETADYLTKFNGGEPLGASPAPKTQPEVSNTDRLKGTQFEGLTGAPLSTGPSAYGLALDERKRANEFDGVVNTVRNIPDVIGAGFRTNNTAYNIYRTKTSEEIGAPIDWKAPDNAAILKGYTEQEIPYLLDSTGVNDLARRQARIKQNREDMQTLGNNGVGMSLLGGLAGSLLDIDTLAATLPGLGAAGMLTKAGRLARIAGAAASGAASNAAFELYSQPMRPSQSIDDVYMAAMFGLAFGGVTGALAKSSLRETDVLTRIGAREYNKELGREVREAGHSMAPNDGPQRPREVAPQRVAESPAEAPHVAAPLETPRREPEAPAPGGGGPAPHQAPEGAPKREPEAEPPRPPQEQPPAAESGRKWDSSYDKPSFDTKGNLVLPPVRNLADMVEYMTLHSKNNSMLMLMQRAVKNLRKDSTIFDVIDVAQRRMSPRNRGTELPPAMVDKLYGSARRWANGIHRTDVKDDGSLRVLIGLRTNGGLDEEVFTHELIHAATVHKWRRVTGDRVKSYDNGGDPLPKNLRRETLRPSVAEAYDQLNALYKHLKDIAERDKWDDHERLLQNPKELVSYGLTNRAFQERLKSTPAPKGAESAWTAFTRAIAKFLGMDVRESNALNHLVSLSHDLLDPRWRARKNSPSGLLMDAAEGRIVSPDVLDAATNANLSPVFGWGLGLEHRLQSSRIPASVRDLAGKLMGTTVGYKDHRVVDPDVWNGTVKRSEAWKTRLVKDSVPAFHKWAETNGTGRGPLARRADWERFSELVNDYVRDTTGRAFDPEVVRAGNSLRSLMNEVRGHVNNPALERGGVKRGLTETEVLGPDGEKLLVGALAENPNYLPRKHDGLKWNTMVNELGRDGVMSWWAGAFRAARPDKVSAEDAMKWAKWYVTRVEEARLNRGADNLEDMMTGFDRRALLESLIQHGGMDERDAHRIMANMLGDPSKDSGRTGSSLRHRNTIAEDYTASINGREVRLSDFINTNAFSVADSYFRRMASSIELADKLDVYKQSDIGNLIDKATTRQFGDPTPEHVMARAKEDLKFTFERIQGIPQTDKTVLSKTADMFLAYNVITKMGGAVFNQLAELGMVIGTMGFRATMQAVPELRRLRRDMRTGRAPTDLLDHIENTMGGVGAEYITRISRDLKDDWQTLLGEGSKWGQRLDKAETLLNAGASGLLNYTGMTGAMVQQKRVHMIALFNHFVGVGAGDKKSGFLSKPGRAAQMGLSDQDVTDITKALADNIRGSRTGMLGGKFYDVDLQKFVRENPELNAKLELAMMRESRRVIQENDLASMVPIMGETIGKVMFQFMNFTIQGWNKSMLYAMHHRDSETFFAALHGSLLAGIAYSARTSLDAMGKSDEERQKFLDQRMSTKQIVANSFGRIAQASLLPTLYDTTLGNVTGTMFSGMKTTSDVSSLASMPTVQAVQGLLSTGQIIRNGFSDETQTTQRDVRKWSRLIPFNNAVGMSNLLNRMTADLPTSQREPDAPPAPR